MRKPPVSWLQPGVQVLLLFALLHGCSCEPSISLKHVPDSTRTDPPELLASGGADSTLGVDPCTDGDGDGFGVGPGCLGPDCDDGDPALGANGERSCYTGPAGTLGVGLCAAGLQTCRDGLLSTCGGEVTPQSEVCDGLDNNCNGEADEQVFRACYTGPDGTDGVGACVAGVQGCLAGSWGECVAEVTPTTEVCDGVDSDCDGLVDEGLGRSCYSGPPGTEGVGACHAGTEACMAGSFDACVGDVTPTEEVCDGVDNDCDGQVDEGLVRSCYDGPDGTAGVGICRAGTQTCSAGQWGTCKSQVLPGTEVCDARDNDCNGLADDALVRACYSGPSGTEGVGLCHGGSQTCQAGRWGTCTGQVVPVAETCDAQDNNCNGSLDESVSRYRHDRGNEAPPPAPGPVDIIVIVDNSGSMGDEIVSVEDNLNTHFAQALATSGLDYRVILLSKHGPASSEQSICIRSPLSGNGDCSKRTPCPINGPRFFHYNDEVGSSDALRIVLDTYNVPDSCNLAPKGWSQWLRPGAERYFLLITDGESSEKAGESDLAADLFEQRLFSLTPAAFGSATDRNYRFHLIGGLAQKSPPGTPWLPADPLVTQVCTAPGGSGGDGPDVEYQKLSRRTGGLRFSVCAYTRFDLMFQQVADAITSDLRYTCSFRVPQVPADSSMENTYGELWPTNGGSVRTLPHVEDASTCAGTSFYNEGTTVYLCPDACTQWRNDPTALIDILFTCTRQVGVLPP